MLKQRLYFINKALNSSQFSPEEKGDLLWERDCIKRELENQKDTEYVNRIAKLKAEAQIEEISDKLVIKRK